MPETDINIPDNSPEPDGQRLPPVDLEAVAKNSPKEPSVLVVIDEEGNLTTHRLTQRPPPDTPQERSAQQEPSTQADSAVPPGHIQASHGLVIPQDTLEIQPHSLVGPDERPMSQTHEAKLRVPAIGHTRLILPEDNLIRTVQRDKLADMLPDLRRVDDSQLETSQKKQEIDRAIEENQRNQELLNESVWKLMLTRLRSMLQEELDGPDGSKYQEVLHNLENQEKEKYHPDNTSLFSSETLEGGSVEKIARCIVALSRSPAIQGLKREREHSSGKLIIDRSHTATMLKAANTLLRNYRLCTDNRQLHDMPILVSDILNNDTILSFANNTFARYELYTLLNQTQTDASMKEQILDAMEIFQDTSHMTAAIFGIELYLNFPDSKWIERQENLRQRLLSILETKPLQSLYEGYEAIQQSAQRLVFASDPRKDIENSKIGFELEGMLRTKFGTIPDIDPSRQSWAQGTDLNVDVEIRKPGDGVAFTSSYRNDLVTLWQWSYDHLKGDDPARSWTTHIHLDDNVHPKEPSLGGLFSVSIRHRGKHPTHECCGFIPPTSPSSMIALIELTIEDSLIVNSKNNALDISEHPPTDWRQMVWGRIADHFTSPQARLNALAALRDPKMMAAYDLPALAETYGTDIFHYLMEEGIDKGIIKDKDHLKELVNTMQQGYIGNIDTMAICIFKQLLRIPDKEKRVSLLNPTLSTFLDSNIGLSNEVKLQIQNTMVDLLSETINGETELQADTVQDALFFLSKFNLSYPQYKQFIDPLLGYQDQEQVIYLIYFLTKDLPEYPELQDKLIAMLAQTDDAGICSAIISAFEKTISDQPEPDTLMKILTMPQLKQGHKEDLINSLSNRISRSDDYYTKFSKLVTSSISMPLKVLILTKLPNKEISGIVADNPDLLSNAIIECIRSDNQRINALKLAQKQIDHVSISIDTVLHDVMPLLLHEDNRIRKLAVQLIKNYLGNEAIQMMCADIANPRNKNTPIWDIRSDTLELLPKAFAYNPNFIKTYKEIIHNQEIPLFYRGMALASLRSFINNNDDVNDLYRYILAESDDKPLIEIASLYNPKLLKEKSSQLNIIRIFTQLDVTDAYHMTFINILIKNLTIDRFRKTFFDYVYKLENEETIASIVNQLDIYSPIDKGLRDWFNKLSESSSNELKIVLIQKLTDIVRGDDSDIDLLFQYLEESDAEIVLSALKNCCLISVSKDYIDYFISLAKTNNLGEEYLPDVIRYIKFILLENQFTSKEVRAFLLANS
ncbi:MAG: hypothetical protein ACOCXQ_04115 [Patescibacteria group bacterium]